MSRSSAETGEVGCGGEKIATEYCFAASIADAAPARLCNADSVCTTRLHVRRSHRVRSMHVHICTYNNYQNYQEEKQSIYNNYRIIKIFFFKKIPTWTNAEVAGYIVLDDKPDSNSAPAN